MFGGGQQHTPNPELRTLNGYELEIAPDTKPDAAGTSSGYIMLANLAGEAGRRDLARAYLKRAIALDRSVKPKAKEVAKELGVRL